MSDRLGDFLSPLVAEAEEDVRWGDMSLRMSSYLHDRLPPLEFVTSVRAIVLTPIGVAVLHNPDEVHLLPGGRLEDGEDLAACLLREVEEETGCRLADPIYFGFIHFEHQTAKPAGYAYPYPSFLQVVYASQAEIVGDAADPTGYEERVEFVSVKEVQTRSFPMTQVVFLESGLRLLGAGNDRGHE